MPIFERDSERKHLPIGSGPYTIGCVDFMNDHTKDGVLLRLFYPTEHKDIKKCQMQWPLWLPRKQYGKGYCYFRRKNTKVFGRLFNWIGGDIYVPALWQAPVLNNGQKFPVIVFSHGLGGNRTTYTTLCSDLASQGFVVAAIEHRDGSASMTFVLKLIEEHLHHNHKNHHHRLHRDHSFTEEWVKYERQEKEDDFHIRNKQLYHRIQECSQVVDLLESVERGEETHSVLGIHWDITQLQGKLDLSRLAVMGHSFGGATCIASAAKDKRFRLSVALDTWMLPLEENIYKDVTQPVLLVNTEIFQWKENVKSMFYLQSINPSDTIIITVKGTCHQSQTDFQFVVNAALGRFFELRHTLDPYIAMEINSKSSLGFLWKHLNIPAETYYEDILSGNHDLVIKGTNLKLS
ncbi:platelet-activating factor acetylhydrolase 2, cytoplasmic [Lingula anatina]|uniref:1-alkyl-2-acetylglycerophosphocholine esterase n=1 Tax=Lingula anatina TaxID=7574 RepID=A0A1S3H5Z2_LINAN|nr:platelet-activating factor acetylhydrolase 2, cytoplasmic [Lingula anatina]|eukprot:XP_013380544.1 platelet-activating factor acetylhydrolase 2, cytoplasmic [Lingula anatina]